MNTELETIGLCIIGGIALIFGLGYIAACILFSNKKKEVKCFS